MTQVVTLEGYRPAARYDEIPWTQARIEEAATADGSWTALETIDLDPVDTDPAHPQLRSFTTELASSTDGLWYRIVFLDATGDSVAPTEPVQNIAPTAGARDLCAIADVLRYAPGYSPASDENSDQTLAVLQALITAESVTQLNRGREFVAIADADTRIFDLTATHVRRRQLRIGDATEITTVTIVDNLGSTVETVDEGDWVALPRTRNEWQPIEKLWFPPSSSSPAQLGCGYTLEVEAVWGFPQVPSNVVQAVAKLVIVRYVTEIARDGTAFAEALKDVNLAQLYESAAAELDSYARPGIA